MNLQQLNTLPNEQAFEWFYQTCSASCWCEQMVLNRPYETFNDILSIGHQLWSNMQESDLLEAFAGHPMIGDIKSLKEKYAATANLAANEQSGTQKASDQTLESLKQANSDYLTKNGFIFIICASGLSADEMLANLKIRLNNERDEELTIAAEHQFNITKLRLTKGLSAQLVKGN